VSDIWAWHPSTISCAAAIGALNSKPEATETNCRLRLAVKRDGGATHHRRLRLAVERRSQWCQAQARSGLLDESRGLVNNGGGVRRVPTWFLVERDGRWQGDDRLST
jgi:hypothetical protein